MKKITIFAIVLAIVIIAGCAGGTYSRLQPIPPPPGPAVMTQGSVPVVAIGPIGVPGWILRASIVSETELSAANISSVDMRAGLLSRDIPAVVSINFERLLAPAGIRVIRTSIGTSANYRIAVDINALDVTPSNLLDTRAQWTLYRADAADPVIMREVAFATPIAGQDDVAVQSAMSRSLADLTRIITKDFEGFLGIR
ncbi:MAG: ABC-type transport auxiliary lipoprotein family protein [Syntrophorhabdus sp.]